MYVSEHNPPHFHVWYNDYKAIVTIEEGIVKGSIPRRALTLVYEWLDLHKRELMENWELLREFKSPNKLNLWNNMDDILTIKSASYVGDYSIVAEFSNGETRLLDLANLSHRVGVCLKCWQIKSIFVILPLTHLRSIGIMKSVLNQNIFMR